MTASHSKGHIFFAPCAVTDERCLRTAVVMALMSYFDSYFISPQRRVLLFGLFFFFKR